MPYPSGGGRSIAECRRLHEERLLGELDRLAPRFLVMAGYMRIVTPRLLAAFRSERGYCRVVNIHPSLLPAFPGVGGYAQAFRYGAKVAGATVHLVDEELDSGPILAQAAFSLADCRDEEAVMRLGKRLEQELYPRTLSWVLAEKFEVVKRERRLCVCPL